MTTTEQPKKKLNKAEFLAKLKQMDDLLGELMSDGDYTDPDIYESVHFLSPGFVGDRIGEAIGALEAEHEDE